MNDEGEEEKRAFPPFFNDLPDRDDDDVDGLLVRLEKVFTIGAS